MRTYLGICLILWGCGPTSPPVPPPGPPAEDCDYPLRGTIDTVGPLASAEGLTRYDYSVERRFSSATLTLRGAQEAIGEFQIDTAPITNASENTSTPWTIGRVSINLTLKDGSSARATISHRALGVALGGNGSTDGRPLQRRMRIEHEGRSLWIASPVPTEPVQAPLRTYFAPTAEVTQEPALGFSTLMDSAQGTLQAYAYEAEGPDQTQELLWLEQVGLDAWDDAPAIRTLFAVLFDDAWFGPIVEHIARCEPELPMIGTSTGTLQSTRRGLILKSCMEAAAGLGAAGGTAIAAAFGGPIAIAGFALGGLPAAALGLYSLSECFCESDERGILCGPKCDATECNNTCQKMIVRQCDRIITARGTCWRRSTFENQAKEFCKCEITERKLPECDLPEIIGDPHIGTFDGRRYDFQSAGEFVAVESFQGAPFVVQVRMEPYREGTCSDVSVNTAIATQLGATRVGLYLNERKLDIYFDDALVQIPPGANRLLDGNRVERLFDNEVVIHFEDSSEVVLRGQDLYFDLAPELAQRVRGLIGAADDDPDNALVFPNGRALQLPASWSEIHGEFADAWRVSQASSLFNYAPGQNTESFSLEDFPSSYQDPASLPAQARQEAQTRCVEAGVEDRGTLEDCILDVVCTGDDSFIQTHENEAERDRIPLRIPLQMETWQAAGPVESQWSTQPTRARLTEGNDSPAFLVRPLEDRAVILRGRFNINALPRAYAGLVFGLQAPTSTPSSDIDTFLFSWKGGGDTELEGVTAQEGFTVARVTGTLDQDRIRDELWGQQPGPQYEVLDAQYGAGEGFDGDYDLELIYAPDRIELRMFSTAEDRIVYEYSMAPPAGERFPPGRIGLYSLRQNWVGLSSVELIHF